MFALLLRFLLLRPEDGFQYLTFYPAVVVSFYLFGIGPSILVTALCTVAAFYFFMTPVFTWIITPESVIGGISFVAFAVLIGWIVNQIHAYIEAQERTALELSRFRAIIESTTDAVCANDLHGVITHWNPAANRLYGYTTDEVVGKSITLLVPEGSAEDVMALIRRVQQGEFIEHYRAERLCKDGKRITVLSSLSPIRNRAGQIVGVSSVGHDISDQDRLEQLVREMAFHDTLTGLANRRLLDDRISLARASNQRNRLHSALLFLDLDNFKPLNDNYGHEAGDLFLLEVANRLTSCVRAIDTVSRIGGDEFVILITDLGSDAAVARQSAHSIAEKIRRSIERPFLLEGKRDEQGALKVSWQCTASIGVLVFSGEAEGNDELLKRADRAMYRAKEAGRNQIQFDEVNS